MAEIISIRDMLNTMMMRGQDGQLIPFSIVFVTADLKKGTGGDRITFDSAVFVGGPTKRTDKKRNPNHYNNMTRNIRHVNSDRITTIHPHLVIRFNGMGIAQ